MRPYRRVGSFSWFVLSPCKRMVTFGRLGVWDWPLSRERWDDRGGYTSPRTEKSFKNSLDRFDVFTLYIRLNLAMVLFTMQFLR